MEELKQSLTVRWEHSVGGPDSEEEASRITEYKQARRLRYEHQRAAMIKTLGR